MAGNPRRPYIVCGLPIGEGVRELEDASDGEGVMEPSSEPRTDSVSRSVSSGTSCVWRLDERVTAESESGAPPRARAGRELALLLMRCFGANGGLFVLGWNSIMGRNRCSQLYCFASDSPRSKGIQVPIAQSSSAAFSRQGVSTRLGISRSLLALSRALLSGLRVPGHAFSAACQIQRL